MATIETVNPTTGESMGSVPDMEASEVRQAVQRARAAFRIWGRLEFPERRDQLLRMRDLMLDRADDLVKRICDETGKALFAGNTVVLKPSEVTPLVGLLVGGLFGDGCDYPDIVQVVTGGGATGSNLIGSGVQKVCFTGSVATGRKVMAKAAETLTPVTLELGGKDPMVVLDDADVDRAAKGAVWGAFSNSGQTCIAVERVYATPHVYDAFVEKVVAETRAIRQGRPSDKATTDVGSMTFPPQLDTVERHLADAVEKGAKVLTGGRRRTDL